MSYNTVVQLQLTQKCVFSQLFAQRCAVQGGGGGGGGVGAEMQV